MLYCLIYKFLNMYKNNVILEKVNLPFEELTLGDDELVVVKGGSSPYLDTNGNCDCGCSCSSNGNCNCGCNKSKQLIITITDL
jgi:hypothetical protein